MSDTAKPTQPSRRGLLKAGAAAAAFPYVVPASALGRDGATPPSERVVLGAIGVNGMGSANLAACYGQPDVTVAAICDVDKARRDAAVARCGGTPKAYSDWRQLLDQKEIDAVIIATTPHWHALMAIEAAQAGKDVYLQKPMTLYPDETLAVRNAMRVHNRVCQVGTQIHATDNYRRVVEYVRSGKLGHVSVVRTFNVMNQGPGGIGHAPKEEPPAGLDWEMWLGPGPKRPYNRLLHSDAYNHCSFWDYSGGWTPGMAPHIIDLPIWALELGAPLRTTCHGGRYLINDDGDVPDTQEVLWDYGNVTMHWTMSMVNSFGFDFGRGEPARRLGIYMHGVNGTLSADYGGFTVTPEGAYLADKTPPEASIPSSPGQEREWLDCVKSRKQPLCSVDYHWKVDIALTLANLSYRLKRTVRFDDQAERIVGDAEAARLARPVYRAPWRFPAEYLKRKA